MMENSKIKEGLLKATIVLLPTYITAYFTDKMVYVIPMLAAASFVAVSLSSSPNIERRVEEDGFKAKDDGTH
jgi:small neutral amino acid transporter SnatA (MarC family)